MKPALEVADIFRRHGAAYRDDQAATLSNSQRRVMAAIETCRTSALGGHVERCADCGEVRISYNSCRDRHCPKCQSLARAQWLADRQAELLPVPYFHVVFTMPAAIAVIALQNKAVVYDILFKAAAEAVRYYRRRSQAPRCRDWHDRSAPYLGAESLSPPPCPLHRARWRPGARRSLDCLPTRVLPVRSRTLPTLPQAVSGTAAGSVRHRRDEFLRSSHAAHRSGSIHRASPAVAPDRLPSRWGRRRPHPSQTRTCGFPASGSSRERLARGGVTVDDPGGRQRVASQEFVEAVPPEPALPISPRQPFPPNAPDLVGEPA
jgi:hypothetical protein